MKKAKTLEERYPVVEEGGESFASPPDPLVVPLKDLTRNLDKVEMRLFNAEKRPLWALADITRGLIEESHPMAAQLAEITTTLMRLHQAKKEPIDELVFSQRTKASKRRKHVTLAELEAHRTIWLEKHGNKIRGWKKNAMIEFEIASVRTLNEILKE